MIADESLVTLNGLKKYDRTKGTAVIEANELPASPLNKVYNVGDDVYSKDVRLSTYQQMIDEVDKVKVDGNTQDANRNIISKAVLDVDTLPSTIGDKVYREETSTTQTTTFTFRYGMTRTEIEALGFVYDQEASSTNVQLYRWPETADKTEISFQIGTRSYIYKLTANTLDYNTSTGNYRVYVPAEQGGPQYYITSIDTNKDYNFTVKETTYGEVKVYAKDTELATKEYADKFIPLTQKAAIKELLTTDDDINTLSSEYSKTIDETGLSINDTGIVDEGEWKAGSITTSDLSIEDDSFDFNGTEVQLSDMNSFDWVEV